MEKTLKRFENHCELIEWLLNNDYKWECGLRCGIILSKKDDHAIIVWDSDPYGENGYISFTATMDIEELLSCKTVTGIQSLAGYLWSSIDNLAINDEGNLVHVDETSLVTGGSTDRRQKEFDREESSIIESFLDLYCHDCPDKTECDGCRLGDVWDYLYDMGDLIE